jgi:hypothetical protein
MRIRFIDICSGNTGSTFLLCSIMTNEIYHRVQICGSKNTPSLYSAHILFHYHLVNQLITDVDLTEFNYPCKCSVASGSAIQPVSIVSNSAQTWGLAVVFSRCNHFICSSIRSNLGLVLGVRVCKG